MTHSEREMLDAALKTLAAGKTGSMSASRLIVTLSDAQIGPGKGAPLAQHRVDRYFS